MSEFDEDLIRKYFSLIDIEKINCGKTDTESEYRFMNYALYDGCCCGVL